MSIITNFDNNFTIVRNADVQVFAVPYGNGGLGQGNIAAQIVVDDQFIHTFHPKHSVSQSLQAGVDAIQQRFQNGTFFFKQDEDRDSLITYQDGRYNGFIHSDDNIAQLIQHIGSTSNFDKSAHTNTTSKTVRLQNIRSNVELQVPGLQSGGEMNSQLSFAWDPFSSHVRAIYKIIRLVCSNGMVGLADFMNSKVPLVNDWQRHMEIVDKQLQNKMTQMIGTRMSAMTKSHASIRDCFRVKNACMERLKDDKVIRSHEEANRLRNIALIVDPMIHLKGKVSETILQDSRLADVTASHLSEFTVWNMLTEMASHTSEVNGNSQTALHKHANAILVDRDGGGCANNISNKVHHQLAFQNVDAAFARDMVA